jgi:hypothetical protein
MMITIKWVQMSRTINARLAHIISFYLLQISQYFTLIYKKRFAVQAQQPRTVIGDATKIYGEKQAGRMFGVYTFHHNSVSYA